MAYETGTATDAVELLQKLKTFVTANGYLTTDSYEFAVGNRDAGEILKIEKGGNHCFLRSFINSYNVFATTHYTATSNGFDGIAAIAADAIDPAATTWHQMKSTTYKKTDPIKTDAVYLPTIGAVLSYHFFAYENPNCLAVAVEYRAGEYALMVWGELDTYMPSSPWYFTGSHSSFAVDSSSTSYWSAQLGDGNYQYKYLPFNTRSTSQKEPHIIYSDTDHFTGYSRVDGDVTNASAAEEYVVNSINCSSDSNCAVPHFSNSSSDSTQYGMNHLAVASGFSIRPLIPIYYYLENSTGRYSYAGAVREMAAVNSEGLLAGDTLQYGADTYVVLPAWKMDWAQTSAANNDNFKMAIAFKTN